MSAAPEHVGKTTTMAALKVADSSDARVPSVSMGFATLQSFELMQRAAKLLAASTLVPDQYRGNLPNCVIALNMATRIGADPLLVMQNLYVVHGRPGWSAKFLIATFNQCGRFAAIRYRWTGTQGKDDWSCQAYSKELTTGELIEGPIISIALAKKEGWYEKKGSKWQTIPQLMLMYRAAAWLINTHAPEISMGLQTEEEIHDVYDAQRESDGRFTVDLDSLRRTEEQIEKQAAEYAAQQEEPTFDADSALAALKAAKTLDELKAVWDSIIASVDAAGAALPVEVEALFKDRKAAFEQALEKDGKLPL